MNIKHILLANTVSAAGSGLLFVTLPGAVSEYLGNSVPYVIPITGIILVIYGLRLFITAFRQKIGSGRMRYFAVSNFSWVLLTIVLIMLERVIITPQGIVAALLLAVLVAVFGGFYFKSYRKLSA